MMQNGILKMIISDANVMVSKLDVSIATHAFTLSLNTVFNLMYHPNTYKTICDLNSYFVALHIDLRAS